MTTQSRRAFTLFQLLVILAVAFDQLTRRRSS